MNIQEYIQHLLFVWHFDPNENKPRKVDYLYETLVTPNYSQIWGPDTSHWDGNVDFNITKARGAKFAIMKCMDGTVETRYFRDNYRRARDAGLLVGGYQWLYPNSVLSCRLQAQTVSNFLKDFPLDIPLAIDFEWTRYRLQNANPNYTDLDLWATERSNQSDDGAILYSAPGYMNQFGRIPDALRAKFKGFWFANYDVTAPMLPLGFTVWNIWQFSASGDAIALAPGDTGKLELDLNYMTDKFYLMLTGGQTPVEGVPMFYKAIGNITIRSTPEIIDSNRTGQYVLTGDVIESDTQQNGFAHITRLWHNNILQPVSNVWCGTAYLQQTEFTPPVKVPFTLSIDGYKPFSGELEKA